MVVWQITQPGRHEDAWRGSRCACIPYVRRHDCAEAILPCVCTARCHPQTRATAPCRETWFSTTRHKSARPADTKHGRFGGLAAYSKEWVEICIGQKVRLTFAAQRAENKWQPSPGVSSYVTGNLSQPQSKTGQRRKRDKVKQLPAGLDMRAATERGRRLPLGPMSHPTMTVIVQPTLSFSGSLAVG